MADDVGGAIGDIVGDVVGEGRGDGVGTVFVYTSSGRLASP